MTTVSIETVVFCDKKYYNSNSLRMLQLYGLIQKVIQYWIVKK